MSITRFVPVFVMAALVWVGCDTTHQEFTKRHASEGWRVRLDCQDFSPDRLNKAIVVDYRSYIANLSGEEKREAAFENRIRLLEDGTGKLAIEMSIPSPGLWSAIWYEHVLVYDTNNKRIKTLKYKCGRSIR